MCMFIPEENVQFCMQPCWKFISFYFYTKIFEVRDERDIPLTTTAFPALHPWIVVSRAHPRSESTHFQVECFQGVSNGGGSGEKNGGGRSKAVTVALWRMPRGGGGGGDGGGGGVPRRRHRRATPSVRLETPAGTDGRRDAPRRVCAYVRFGHPPCSRKGGKVTKKEYPGRRLLTREETPLCIRYEEKLVCALLPARR